MGINGLIPSLLVFGVIPRFPILCSKFPDKAERMKILSETFMEMNTVVAKKRITTALRQNIPSSALKTFKKGDEVLAYREKTKKWVGPYKV